MEGHNTETKVNHVENLSISPLRKFEDRGEILGYPRENLELAVKLTEQGLNSEHIVGYHGTSLEALQEALKSGSLRGAMRYDVKIDGPKDPEHSLFFFPIKEKFEGHPLIHKFHDDSASSEGAEMYAHLLASAHFILTELKLGISDKLAVEHAKNIRLWEDSGFHFEDKEAIEFFLSKGIDRKSLMQLAERAAKRKGVVLGIKDTVRDLYELTDPQQNEGDLSIQIPEGLPLTNLAGIEPLSQDEWDFFLKMQGELRKQEL